MQIEQKLLKIRCSIELLKSKHSIELYELANKLSKVTSLSAKAWLEVSRDLFFKELKHYKITDYTLKEAQEINDKILFLKDSIYFNIRDHEYYKCDAHIKTKQRKESPKILITHKNEGIINIHIAEGIEFETYEGEMEEHAKERFLEFLSRNEICLRDLKSVSL